MPQGAFSRFSKAPADWQPDKSSQDPYYWSISGQLMTAIIIILVFFADRLTKLIAVENLSPGASVAVVKNVFYLTIVHNRGAAFGILKNQLPLFILVAIIAVFLIILNLKKNKVFLNKLALSLILAGALGNLYDRVAYGGVIDFLDFRVWPVFNIADSAITVGAVLLGYSILKNGKNGHKDTRTQGHTSSQS